jgi:hypothetical protein
MSQQVLSPTRVLEESDATLRAELARLERERKQIVCSLDDRIARLRRLLDQSEPLFANIVKPPEQTVVVETEIERRPRGEMQRKVFEFLLEHPTAGYREMVAAVWREVTPKTHANARNAIVSLRREGWVLGKPGNWQVERNPTKKQHS